MNIKWCLFSLLSENRPGYFLGQGCCKLVKIRTELAYYTTWEFYMFVWSFDVRLETSMIATFYYDSFVAINTEIVWFILRSGILPSRAQDKRTFDANSKLLQLIVEWVWMEWMRKSFHWLWFVSKDGWFSCMKEFAPSEWVNNFLSEWMVLLLEREFTTIQGANSFL